MKAVCVFLALCAVSCHAYEVMLARCMSESHQTQEAMKEYGSIIVTDLQKQKCMSKCLAEMSGWMDAHGNLVEGPAHLMSPEEIRLSTECLIVTGANACEKAYNWQGCIKTGGVQAQKGLKFWIL